jgi:hypothetical protein
MWTCRLVEYEPPYVRGDYQVGDMFWGPTAEEQARRDPKFNRWVYLQCRYLSDYYKENNINRRPLFLVLPDNTLFCVDGQFWNMGEHHGGWEVKGDAPNITVSPSINIVGSYHGWLIDGVLSADCEGRLYDADGWLIRKDNEAQT